MPSTPSSSHSSRSKSRSAAPPERKLSLLLLLVASHQRMTQLIDLELAADGVESNGYAMLSLLGVRGRVRLTEVAAELGMPLTTASDVMRRLEARGFVRRTPNPEDGRSFLFELSAKGDREWRRGWGALQRIDASLVSRIDEQETRRSLEQLNRAFEAALTDD